MCSLNTALRISARRAALAFGCACVLATQVVWAQTAGGGIFSCVDGNGKRLTSDRPIPECFNREQRVLNADGSVRRIVPPVLTPEERAEKEARDRLEAMSGAVLAENVRRDRNLLARYPNEAAHKKARAVALDDFAKAIISAEKRLEVLRAERKPLQDEAEFYVKRQPPLILEQKIEANDTATEALRALVQNQQAEVARINANFDAELARLKKLWAGAPLGFVLGASAPASGASGR